MKELYANRAEWLEARGNSIGGSDIACVMGCGYKTRLQLWQEKTGQKDTPDLSDNERVQFGNDAEPVLRDLFAVTHRNYEVTYEPFNLYRPDDEAFYFAHYSSDGMLCEKETGRLGILEIKTATCITKADWERWQLKVPDNYFCQVMWGMFVTGREYADLFALLKNNEDDYELRTYHFERDDSLEYLNEMKQSAKDFWTTVERKSIPTVTIKL